MVMEIKKGGAPLVWMLGATLLALSSCATTNRWAINGMLDDCKTNGKCAAECQDDIRVTGRSGPGGSNYCDALEIYRAEAIVAGKVQPNGPADVQSEVRWMGYVCGESVARACTARDGLRQLLAKAEATIASDKAAVAAAATSDAAEGRALSDAVTACGQIGDAACKAKCDSENDTSYCVAWAWRLRNTTPPPLADERVYLKKACDAGNQHACRTLPVIDQQIQAQARDDEARQRMATDRAHYAEAAAADEIGTLWSPVRQTADELAQQMWLVQWARQNHRQPEGVLQRVTGKIAEVTRTRFCPAKAAFIAKTTRAEFNTRAATHCKDEAPVGSSEGNVFAGETSTQVLLTAQCKTVFASPCP